MLLMLESGTEVMRLNTSFSQIPTCSSTRNLHSPPRNSEITLAAYVEEKEASVNEFWKEEPVCSKSHRAAPSKC